jgi:hypothetical protein
MKARFFLLWPLAAAGCLETIEEYDSTHSYVPPAAEDHAASQSESLSHPVYRELNRITDMPTGPEKSKAGLEWFRQILDQTDEIQRKAGIDPEQHAYESAYQQARESGASPSEAHWEAQRDMRNMEIFRGGGIPPNF